jgi:DNA-directed RNA polymerase subunit omega
MDDRPGSFFAANHHDALSGREGGNRRQSRSQLLNMNANLIAAASQVIPSTELLVNVVSRRVRQLTFGHRPLVVVPPGMLAADIALTEIIGGKLTSEPAVGQEDSAQVDVVPFPGTLVSGKKAA